MDLAEIEHLLYDGVEGYALSTSGRARMAHAATPSFTYGEVTTASVRRMLEQVEAKPGEVFYDLGSGTGKAVLYAAIIGGMSKAVGVELVPDLYEAAEQVRARYESHVRPAIGSAGSVEFRHGDMLQADLSDADIVFTHCTCFEDDLMRALAEKLGGLRPGARLITVTKSIPSLEFEMLGHEVQPLAWGEATLYYQRRK